MNRKRKYWTIVRTFRTLLLVFLFLFVDPVEIWASFTPPPPPLHHNKIIHATSSGDDFLTSPFSFFLRREPKAWPHAAQCLINSHRLRGGRRRNLQSATSNLLCETPESRSRSYCAEFAHSWPHLLSGYPVEKTRRARGGGADKEDFPPGGGELWAVVMCLICWVVVVLVVEDQFVFYWHQMFPRLLFKKGTVQHFWGKLFPSP